MSLPSELLPVGLLGTGEAAEGYSIERSVRFNSADSAYLSRTPASAGNRKTWTWAGWVKRSALGRDSFFSGDNVIGGGDNIEFSSNDEINIYWNGAFNGDAITLAKFRDLSAWYHIAVAVDTTQAIDTNRVKVYVNGVQQTLTAGQFGGTYGTFPAQNYDTEINTATPQWIGRGGNNYTNFYLADIHFIDGQALAPTSFGEFDDNGIWQPIEYTGSYGTNGFHLDFADNSTAAALGTDTSGNSNTWTVNNISVTAGAGNDSLVDVPTNGTETDTGVGGEVRGNYCTWNPLGVCSSGTPGTASITNGNLDFNDGTNKGFTGTIGMSSGKWYWELYWVSGTANQCYFGITNISSSSASRLPNFAGIRDTGVLVNSNGATTNGSGTSAFSAGSVVQFAYDADNKRLFIGKNNTWLNSSDPSAGTNATYTNVVGDILYAIISDNVDNSRVIAANFGQRPFAYTAPSGFKALNTANLPAPVVTKPSTVMDVALDTGANILSATKALCGGNANFLWIKDRVNGSTNHHLIDIVRDPQLDGTPFLASNSTSDEATLGSYSAPSGNSVGWAWYAGGSTVSNPDGSITSSVRANPSAGFSIVTWTSNGATAVETMGHGLNIAPQLIITKNRDATSSWVAYHASLGNNSYILLDSTNAAGSFSPYWSTSSTTWGQRQSGIASNNEECVAYCFAPVDGYSSFGSYTGNGSTDGPFVYTGFRPRWIMSKASSTGGTGYDWVMYDTERDTYNTANKFLGANTSNLEQTLSGGTVLTDLNFDILSNGFKLRTSRNAANLSGATFIYAAFAENPFALNARAR